MAQNTQLNSEIGERLRLVRRILDIKDYELGEKVGVQRAQVYRWESGTHTIRLEYMIKLLDWLSDPSSKEYRQLKKVNLYFSLDWFISGKHPILK